MYDRTEAYFAGVAAGKADARDDSLIHAIEPPEAYSDQQRDEFISGYLVGQRVQRDNDMIDELSRSFGNGEKPCQI